MVNSAISCISRARKGLDDAAVGANGSIVVVYCRVMYGKCVFGMTIVSYLGTPYGGKHAVYASISFRVV